MVVSCYGNRKSVPEQVFKQQMFLFMQAERAKVKMSALPSLKVSLLAGTQLPSLVSLYGFPQRVHRHLASLPAARILLTGLVSAQ